MHDPGYRLPIMSIIGNLYPASRIKRRSKASGNSTHHIVSMVVNTICCGYAWILALVNAESPGIPVGSPYLQEDRIGLFEYYRNNRRNQPHED